MLRRPAILALLGLLACTPDDPGPTVPDPLPDPLPLYRVPVVVHVLHHGEPIGTGPNHDRATVERQIQLLNDDFRRRPGTRGHNDHPAGADARIEFFLASTDPDGGPTQGVHRVDLGAVENPIDPNHRFDHLAWYGYWDPNRYVNIWSVPYPEDVTGVFLGEATGPTTDLPGAEFLLPGEPAQAEGVAINAAHFGEHSSDSDYDLGRTLTHEMGHHLGLLHLWGGGNCETNDHCADTPAVDEPVSGCPGEVILACTGEPAMTENYMTFSPDRCMYVFTVEQVERMRYVLETSPYRLFEIGDG